jgi:hypothetical protein
MQTLYLPATEDVGVYSVMLVDIGMPHSSVCSCTQAVQMCLHYGLWDSVFVSFDTI